MLACYYRLYDSDETKTLVSKWVSFYKKYRDILISDIVHVRRPDMQGKENYIITSATTFVKRIAVGIGAPPSVFMYVLVYIYKGCS